MGVKYYKDKPATGRFVYLKNCVTTIFPDGDGVRISPAPVEEREGYEFFYDIGEYIPKEDCANGIYVEESEYDRMKDAMEKEYRRAHPEEYEDEEEDEIE